MVEIKIDSENKAPITWNKAAKLIHGYLHKEEKRNV